ncbi:hypothetical protein PR048_018295 [Dryococelus australis]|uniref:Reverse transcriptase domain-containing protein n=1 Tax=Dryococelus australis TaxID=614101 RepID=A0ABQ9HC18_9NEOP|nr:hypothetical protein PR048_018295 [Dryococelus australis]
MLRESIDPFSHHTGDVRRDRVQESESEENLERQQLAVAQPSSTQSSRSSSTNVYAPACPSPILEHGYKAPSDKYIGGRLLDDAAQQVELHLVEKVQDSSLTVKLDGWIINDHDGNKERVENGEICVHTNMAHSFTLSCPPLLSKESNSAESWSIFKSQYQDYALAMGINKLPDTIQNSPKGQVKLHICLDPQNLNEAIRCTQYPVSVLDQILPELIKVKIFSLLDTENGYWQIKLSEESIKLTAFNTPLAQYRWLRLPFGICSAPEIFQKKLQEYWAIYHEFR